MTRRLLILDVTAMSGDAVCVAGIDLRTGDTVRLADPQPTKRLLALLGGIEPGIVIDVNCKPIRRRERPHVEDHEWDPRSFKEENRAAPAEAMRRMRDSSFPSVTDAFGLAQSSAAGPNGAWQAGCGERSLAAIRIAEISLRTNQEGRLRVSFEEEGGGVWRDVPYQDTQARSHIARCSDCQKKLEVPQTLEIEANMIRVGLTRPFAPDDSERFCWLQVTNLFNKQREHFVEP